MTIRLGYFKAFKGSNTVLLSCESSEVASLRQSLADAMTKGIPFAVHTLARVSGRNPARVILCPRSAPFRLGGVEFVWRLNNVEYADVDSKLEWLEAVDAAHQYFDLQTSGTQLMVSVGEYDDACWDQWESSHE